MHMRLLESNIGKATTSATVRTQNREGCSGSSPSNFIPTLNPFRPWGNDWYCDGERRKHLFL